MSDTVSITFRDSLGHDVSPLDPSAVYVQYDADQPMFDPYSTTLSVNWNGVNVFYNPAYGSPAPLVVYYSAYRVGANGGPGPIDPNLILHGTQGDIFRNAGGGGGILSPLTLPSSPAMSLFSDYIGPVTIMTLQATSSMTIGGRGIVINVPDLQRWRLQRAALRPRTEQSN